MFWNYLTFKWQNITLEIINLKAYMKRVLNFFSSNNNGYVSDFSHGGNRAIFLVNENFLFSVIWLIFLFLFQAYMKKVLKYLEENDRAAEIEEFKANINGVMKDLMGRFKDLQFFSGKTRIYLFENSKLSVSRSFDN